MQLKKVIRKIHRQECYFTTRADNCVKFAKWAKFDMKTQRFSNWIPYSSSFRKTSHNSLIHKFSKCSLRSPRAPRAIRLLQWFSIFLVERNPNETFQRLEEPLCGNLIVLCQGGPTSALSWATFQNYSCLQAATG